MTEDVLNEVLTGTEDAFDAFSTPELIVPPTPADAHQGQITSVTLRRLENEKQTAIISVGLSSRNVPLETSLDIFVPKVYEEGGFSAGFNPKDLPEEEGNKQQTSYRMGFANSDKTATIQRLVTNPDSIARKAGRDPLQLGITKPHSLEEYVENLAKMLVGVDCIFLRRPRGGDEVAFKNQLRCADIISADEAELNPKRFRKYVCAWQQ